MTVHELRQRPPHKEVDLLVIGAGAGGMTAALVGALEGLDTLLCEKSKMVGGTTATSAGTIWVPGTTGSREIGAIDSRENAARYLASVIGDSAGQSHRASFLANGPAAIDYLERRTEVKFIVVSEHPDYLPAHPGATYGGRALVPVPFDGRKLGEDFIRVRPPRREFLALGGMMVAKADIGPLLHPFRSVSDFSHATRLLLRYALDRLKHSRGTRLILGNALVARLLHALRQHHVPICFETGLVGLIKQGGRVTGAVVSGPAGVRTIMARRGVVLATGGVGSSGALRAVLFPKATRMYSLSSPDNTGEGISLAQRAGAKLDTDHASPGFWMPISILNPSSADPSIWPHIILDRAKPGLIGVNAAGHRFANEADSYHEFVVGMLRSDRETPTVPAYLICDRRFIRDYGLGLIRPGARRLNRFIKLGYLIEGATLDELADKTKIDRAGLHATVAAHNRCAESGVDDQFGKGQSAFNRFNGDPDNHPNPCLRKIEHAPFYAVAVWPADLASSVGLATDDEARVLDWEDKVIKGLYACGNDMASVMRGCYPGPGATLGPGIVFAWRAAMHAAGRV